MFGFPAWDDTAYLRCSAEMRDLMLAVCAQEGARRANQ